MHPKSQTLLEAHIFYGKKDSKTKNYSAEFKIRVTFNNENEAQFSSRHRRQQLRELCNADQKPKNNVHNADFTLKIGEYVLDKAFATDFISRRSDAHHFKLSKWTDIKFSVHI